ncbi:MAG: ATP-binding cassette domain-containing protein [Planctomycetota bacterium]|nr:ATP-binding cassette domain-containing protein [Planctomycetota bacterium]MDA0918968.1 ATP-binding cassette domain-containing protein [Planctomycetota bacterium]MDA1158553.1 ATP-binding cassette domain-containing protein [Planctomycetota bacterium]
MEESEAICVKDLSFQYGDRVALDSVSFSVKSGAIFGFLGPNGGGKTTLFSILSTIFPMQSGVVSALGYDIRKDSAAYREQIGVTFQSPGLDRRLTVLENLIHQGHLFGLKGQQLRHTSEELLAQFGVADRQADIVDTLSGGLKRRVELAKCLIHRPSLLLLDEPSTGLDPGARHELWASLEKLRTEQGVTVIVTTHLMDEAERCDELALLHRGKIVAQGSPSQLRNRIPGECLTIVAERPDELKSRLDTELNVEAKRVGETLRIHQANGQALFGQIMDRFPDEIRSISLGKPTLEDVFLMETGSRFAESVRE